MASFRIDEAWLSVVSGWCDPVFEAADAGFAVNQRGPTALLWEADPEAFVRRYPDSRVEDSYGDSWPAPCLDYWAYLEPESGRARLSVEGWNLPDVVVELTGHAELDGAHLAAVFARILGVRRPDR